MAYLAQDQDAESKAQAQQGTDPNAPTILSSPSAAAPTSSTNPNNTAAGAAPTPAKTSSGSFTNLQKYITANTGNDAAMGGAVQNNAQSKATEADTKGAGWQQAAAKTISDNTVTDNGVLGGLATIKQGGAAAPIDKDAFGREYNATYTGPKATNRGNDIAGFGDTGSAYQKVQDYGSLAKGNFADKGALLSDTFGSGGKQYNGGERRLDSFILGSGEGGTNALKNIGDTYSNYTDNFGKIRDAIGAQAQAGETATLGTRDAVQAAAKDALGSVEGRFGAAKGQAGTTSAAEAAKYQALVDAKNADHAAALKAAGLDDATINYLQHNQSNGFDPARLASQGSAYSIGDFADANDVSNYKNLRALLGSANSGLNGAYGDDQLGKTGAATAVNSDLLGSAKSAAGLNSQLSNAVLAKKRAENLEYGDLFNSLRGLATGSNHDVRDIASAADKLGVSAQDLIDAGQLGIDPSAFLKQGSGNYGFGDVGGDQASQYGQLAKLLGIKADLGTHGDAGHTFDRGNFTSALAAKRASRAAQQVAAPVIAPSATSSSSRTPTTIQGQVLNAAGNLANNLTNGQADKYNPVKAASKYL